MCVAALKQQVWLQKDEAPPLPPASHANVRKETVGGFQGGHGNAPPPNSRTRLVPWFRSCHKSTFRASSAFERTRRRSNLERGLKEYTLGGGCQPAAGALRRWRRRNGARAPPPPRPPPRLPALGLFSPSPKGGEPETTRDPTGALGIPRLRPVALFSCVLGLPELRLRCV